MRVYTRVSRNTGVSMGPVSWIAGGWLLGVQPGAWFVGAILLLALIAFAKAIAITLVAAALMAVVPLVSYSQLRKRGMGADGAKVLAFIATQAFWIPALIVIAKLGI